MDAMWEEHSLWLLSCKLSAHSIPQHADAFLASAVFQVKDCRPGMTRKSKNGMIFRSIDSFDHAAVRSIVR